MTDDPESPAIITRMHVERPLTDENTGAEIIGKKGYKRLDRLEYLWTHKGIAEHQFLAGRRLQEDWEASKLENCPGMVLGKSSSSGRNDLPDAKCDAMDRVNAAMEGVPAELKTLVALFLLDHDHPWSLERIAAKVREDRKAVAYGLRVALSLLARHYGYST